MNQDINVGRNLFMNYFFVYSLIFFFGVLVSCSQGKEKPKPDSMDKVYICTSERAKAYHATNDCMGIFNCSEEIRLVDLKEVIDTKSACAFCFDLGGNESTTEGKIGRYVYRDVHNIVHVDRTCPRLRLSAERIFPQTINPNYDTYCMKCVSDDIYERLQGMLENGYE